MFHVRKITTYMNAAEYNEFAYSHLETYQLTHGKNYHPYKFMEYLKKCEEEHDEAIRANSYCL